MIPSLETERLRLRGHRLEDFPAMSAMWADPQVTRFIGGRPFSEEETWARLLRYAGHWRLLGFGYWVVEDRATGRFLGEAGLADFRRAMEPSIHRIPEAGWVLVPSAHGRGFATEAMQAVLAWCDESLMVARTVCLIRPGHTASVRVAEKCGFREFCQTEYHSQASILFERTR